MHSTSARPPPRRVPAGHSPGVDASAYQIPLVAVQELQGVVLVGGVVLPEDEVQEVAIGVHNGQGVQLIGPDDVVGLF